MVSQCNCIKAKSLTLALSGRRGGMGARTCSAEVIQIFRQIFEGTFWLNIWDLSYIACVRSCRRLTGQPIIG